MKKSQWDLSVVSLRLFDRKQREASIEGGRSRGKVVGSFGLIRIKTEGEDT